MENEVVGLLTEIRDLLQDLATCRTAKRFKERERKQRYRKLQSANLSAGQSILSAGQTSNLSAGQKEEEERKENIPPTPPIREKGEEEENLRERETRARASVIPSADDVNAYVQEKHPGKAIDVAACLAYNKVRTWSQNEKRTVDWHDVIDLWISIKGFIEPSPANKTTPTRKYFPNEWILCVERCAKFINGNCTCGEKVPPACRAYPIPPEDCRNFSALEVAE